MVDIKNEYVSRLKNIFTLAVACFLTLQTGIISISKSGEAQAQTVRVGMSWIPNVEYAGVWIAMEKGYFANEGLNIKHFPGGPNAPKPPENTIFLLKKIGDLDPAGYVGQLIPESLRQAEGNIRMYYKLSEELTENE